MTTIPRQQQLQYLAERGRMSEADVTLTDYALAVECAVCAAFLGLTPTGQTWLRNAGMFFFVFLGLSAATGGTVHGFCPDPNSPACRILWQVTLQAVGWASFSTWVLGAGILATGRAARRLALAGIPQIVLFSGGALRDAGILDCLCDPAALLLLAGLLARLARQAPPSGRSSPVRCCPSSRLPAVQEDRH